MIKYLEEKLLIAEKKVAAESIKSSFQSPIYINDQKLGISIEGGKSESLTSSERRKGKKVKKSKKSGKNQVSQTQDNITNDE